MTGYKIHQLSYNADESAFEGRVDIIRETGTFRYPCSIYGPQDMARDAVESGLLARAAAMSDSRR